MILTNAERKRFLEYLEAEAYSSEQLVEQMKKIAVPGELLKQNQVLVLACRVLIDRLRSGESMTMKSGE